MIPIGLILSVASSAYQLSRKERQGGKINFGDILGVASSFGQSYQQNALNKTKSINDDMYINNTNNPYIYKDYSDLRVI